MIARAAALLALVLLSGCAAINNPARRITFDRPVPTSPHEAAWGTFSVPR